MKRPTLEEQGPGEMRAARQPPGAAAESNAAEVQKAGYSGGRRPSTTSHSKRDKVLEGTVGYALGE